MHWLFFAISAQFLWAIVNHIDKYLVNKVFSGGVGAVLIFTAMANTIFLPILLFFQPQILQTPIDQAILATSIGVLYVIASLMYFYALKQEDTTKISVLWQMTAPLTYLLAILFLDEFLNTKQILGAIIILTGGVITMIHFDNGSFRFKKKVFLFMVGAVSAVAISGLIFKIFANNFDFWSAVFFEIFGATLTGIFMLVAVKPYRKEFLEGIKKNRLKIFSFNMSNESLQISATVAFRYATMLAPLALVQVTSSLNSIFVFVIAILISKFLPRISEEKFKRFDVFQKVLGIIVVTIGIILIEI